MYDHMKWVYLNATDQGPGIYYPGCPGDALEQWIENEWEQEDIEWRETVHKCRNTISPCTHHKRSYMKNFNLILNGSVEDVVRFFIDMSQQFAKFELSGLTFRLYVPTEGCVGEARIDSDWESGLEYLIMQNAS